ncbi:sugar phosphate isomerase/epimerase family protein [Zavarzinella formosa]|uniref:sugar phosphate isomerase/epimerase family protein n=1 Tax=Zavarzinella formosa TaxID=360055 RepID=UPI0003020CA8|nr:sugar phosphate isomerase/epimerase family protein [Zavarzinella formosa]
MRLSRRELFSTTAALSLGLSDGRAIEPIPRSHLPRLKLSLAAYSFRQWLDIKKPKEPAMTLTDFIDYAAARDLDAVELTAYYFPETTPEYLGKLKRQATKLGLDVSGTAVGNDFCVADPEKLKSQLEHVKSWTEHTARLGGKTMRIFAGTVPKGDTEENAVKRCIPVIQEACEYAARWGVILALENHGGITATAEQLLHLVQSVKHENFGVNLDTGNFRTTDPYGDLAKLAPYAVTVQVKTEITAKGGKTEEADIPRLIKMLRDVKYRGYVALEYEAKEDAKIAVPKYLTEMRKLMNAQG